MSTLYGRSFRWRQNGMTITVHTALHPTMEAATAELREMRDDSGYTPPKWWQWWRRAEHRVVRYKEKEPVQ